MILDSSYLRMKVLCRMVRGDYGLLSAKGGLQRPGKGTAERPHFPLLKDASRETPLKLTTKGPTRHDWGIAKVAPLNTTSISSDQCKRD